MQCKAQASNIRLAGWADWLAGASLGCLADKGPQQANYSS